MPRETMEIRAIWHERPSLFAKGMMRWVAETTGATGSDRVGDSTAFPLDDDYVADDGIGDEDRPYIRIDRDAMPPEQRKVVEKMHAEFVARLESDGWVRSGDGPEWYSARFERGGAGSTGRRGFR